MCDTKLKFFADFVNSLIRVSRNYTYEGEESQLDSLNDGDKIALEGNKKCQNNLKNYYEALYSIRLIKLVY